MRTLPCTHALYYDRRRANVISALIKNWSMHFKNIHRKAMTQKYALNSTVFMICACAIFSDNDVALVDLYSSETTKERIKHLNRLFSTCREM